MNKARFKITLKVVLGYLTLMLIGIASAWYLFTEINRYFNTRNDLNKVQYQLFNLSNLVSQLYENESFARLAVRLDNEESLDTLFSKNDSLKQALINLKKEIELPKRQAKIDSILFLLKKKEENYLALRAIYTDNQRTEYLNSALYKLSEIETAFGKVTVEDFTQNPERLSNREKALMNEIVQLLNKNRPPSETRKLNEKTLDSIVVATKLLLNRVKNDAATQQLIILQTENALWKNDNDISRQIREIFESLETERIEQFSALQTQSAKILDKNWKTLLVFGSLGLLLALLFSFLILQDFFKNQKLSKALEIANTRAENLLQRREQLLATVSHDLRSPLSNLLGYKALLEKSDLNQKQKYYLGHISKSADYVHRLADDLLNFSQLEKNKILLDERPFSILDLMEEMSAASRQLLTGKPVAMELKLGENLPNFVVGDPMRIRQILMNLLGNACKFTASGTVELKAELVRKSRKFAFICFTVTDSGPGMDSAALQQVFNEFTQARGIDKKYGGAGLGLAIAKRLTELMEGEISVQSQIGTGSSFRVILPLKWTLTTSEKNIKKNNVPTINRQQVLVWVDDDEAHLRLVGEWLKATNLVYKSFSGSDEALQYLKIHPCDLLVTDLEMPGLNGYALARYLKVLPQCSGLPVVAVSGMDAQTVQESGEGIFEKFIQKPMSPEKFNELLTCYFGNFQNDERQTTHLKYTSNLKTSVYSLDKTATFLNNDVRALLDFLEVFTSENQKNIQALQNAFKEDNGVEVQKIAHKMLPLYRQFEAVKLVKVLESLEKNAENTKGVDTDLYLKLQVDLDEFQRAIKQKLEEIRDELSALSRFKKEF